MITKSRKLVALNAIGRLSKMIKDENGNEYVIIRHTDDHIYAVNKKLVQVEDKGEEE